MTSCWGKTTEDRRSSGVAIAGVVVGFFFEILQSSSAIMQASWTSVEYKDRVIQSLRRMGAIDYCPSLSRESIDYCDGNRLRVSIVANTIRGADTPAVLQANIEDLAEYFAAALRLSGEDAPGHDDARSVRSMAGVGAVSTDVIRFRARVDQCEFAKLVKFAAKVKRGSRWYDVVRGTRMHPFGEPQSSAALHLPTEATTSSDPPTTQRETSGKRPAAPPSPIQPSKRAAPSSSSTSSQEPTA